VPSFTVSSAPKITWISTIIAKLAPSSMPNSGTVRTMNRTEAVISASLAPETIRQHAHQEDQEDIGGERDAVGQERGCFPPCPSSVMR
jgi:hypothetical protein